MNVHTFNSTGSDEYRRASEYASQRQRELGHCDASERLPAPGYYPSSYTGPRLPSLNYPGFEAIARNNPSSHEK